MRAVLLALCLLLAASLATANPYRYARNTSYAGESVIRCPIAELNDISTLDELRSNVELNFWATNAHDGTVDIQVNRDEFLQVQQAFNGRCRPFIANLETRMREWETELLTGMKDGDWHSAFHPYNEVVDWYKGMSEKHSVMRFIPSVGKSVEGRDMPVVVLTAPNGKQDKKRIFWTAGIHAREWLAVATVNYIADQLVQDFEKGDAVIRDLLENVEIHILLYVNPDGVAFSWSSNRLWRKSRNANPGSSCIGTDLNRNAPDHWGQGGSSRDPCSDTFMGQAPASAPEIQAVINYFKGIRPVIAGFDWHTYSQLLLRPYGWSRNTPPHEAQHFALGADMANAIRSNGGMVYQNIKSIELYQTTGSLSDWYYGDDATNGNGGYRAVSFTFELRDRGSYGFIAPPSAIRPTGVEMYAAMKVALPKIVANPLRA